MWGYNPIEALLFGKAQAFTNTQNKDLVICVLLRMMPACAIARMNELGREAHPFFFAVSFEGDEAVVYTKTEQQAHGLAFQIGGLVPGEAEGVMTAPPAMQLHPVSYRQYLEAFQLVQRHLHAGNSYLVNLTFPTRIETNWSLESVYALSRAPFKLLWPGRFAVFSPERFVRITEGIITTCPMKGTIDARLPNAEARLLADRKELAEHATIVDLLRNDLSQVARQVRVARFRYVTCIRTNRKDLLQASSEITGQLLGDYRSRLGNILAALLPAGSVSGAPKRKTLDIISAAEGAPRGFYTGVFGYFDGRNLDSAVMIRFLEQRPDGLYFRSGGGITVFSDPEREYQELLDKVYIPTG